MYICLPHSAVSPLRVGTCWFGSPAYLQYNEIFYFFYTKLSKSSAHFTLTAHVDSDQLHFKGSVATCGSQLPYWVALV